MRGPENACTASKQEAGEDDVAKVSSIIVAKVRANEDTVSKTAEREGNSNAKGICNGASKETDDSESGIERGESVITNERTFRNLACTTEAVESIEHAFALSVGRRNVLSCIALPGHRKHTNDTRINCDSGEAYQGSIIGPSFELLYLHPVGITNPVDSRELNGVCILVVVGPFSASAMRLDPFEYPLIEQRYS